MGVLKDLSMVDLMVSKVREFPSASWEGASSKASYMKAKKKA